MLMGIINALSGKLVGDKQNVQKQPVKSDNQDFAKALSQTQDQAPRSGKAIDDVSVLAQIAPGTSVQTSAVQAFLEYQDMNMGEKIRASYLANKGMTEEDLAALSPEEQLKIEEEIKEAIKRKLVS